MTLSPRRSATGEESTDDFWNHSLGSRKGGSHPAFTRQALRECSVGTHGGAGGPLARAACGRAPVTPAIGRSWLQVASSFPGLNPPLQGTLPHISPQKEGCPRSPQGGSLFVSEGGAGTGQPVPGEERPQDRTAASFQGL